MICSNANVLVGWSHTSAGPPILYRARINITSFLCPMFAILDERLEWVAIKVDKRLADYRFHFPVAAFHVHHHGDWHATGHPLVRKDV